MSADWVPEARKQYRKLKSYAAVARVVGVSPGAVRYQLSPQARKMTDENRRKWRKTETGKASVAATNAKRSEAKREYAEGKRATCERCGQERGVGTAWESKTGAGLCRKCRNEIRSAEAEAKRKRIEELWNQKPMLTGAQIAEALDISEGALRQTINTMRKLGTYKVPRRYGHRQKGG